MLLIIRSSPYLSENVLGGLFIAFSVGEAQLPSKVVFVDDGLYCLIPNQNMEQSLSILAISDIIQQLVGTVLFYYYCPEDSNYSAHSSFRQLLDAKCLVPGVKALTFPDLFAFLTGEEQNLLLL